MTSSQRTGTLLILAAAAGYAFLPILAKVAYDAGLTAQDVVTWRFLFATPGIWLLASRLDEPGADRLPRRGLLLMGVIFAVTAMMAFYALERVSASTFIVLVYAYPAFVALLSLLTGETLSGKGWLALGMTLVGVALTVPDFATGFAESDPLGVLFSITNALTYAVYLVISCRLLRGHKAPARASAWSITGTLLFLLIIAIGNGLNVPQNATAWASVGGIGLFSTVFAIFFVYAGMQRLGAPRAAIVSMAEPVLVLFFSFLLLEEKMQPIQVFGGGLILTGALLIQLVGRSPRPTASAFTSGPADPSQPSELVA